MENVRSITMKGVLPSSTHIEVQAEINDSTYTLIVEPNGKVNYTGPNDGHPAFHRPNSIHSTFDVLTVLFASDVMDDLVARTEAAARRAWGYWWPMEIAQQVK